MNYMNLFYMHLIEPCIKIVADIVILIDTLIQIKV
jgi:hypothetical protein